MHLLQRSSLLQRRALVVVALIIAATMHGAGTAQNDASAGLIRSAYTLAYNLDHEDAVRMLSEAARLDPDNPTAHRGLASITWLNILFGRGTVTADEYLGELGRKDVTLAPPAEAVARAFHAHVDRAVAAAEAQVARDAGDASAHYALASALGLSATYTATIDGRVAGAFTTARRAYKSAERAAELAPALPDPKLVLGTYRYVVAGMNLPTRLIAYVAGLDGDKEKGLALIEEAAAGSTDVQTEARFALILLYNREKRYDDALRVLGQLQRRYPRNRILWLEAGATSQRAGRSAAADRILTEGLDMLQRDPRPRMFGENALWHYNRGLTRLALARDEDAFADLLSAVESQQARDWVRGRAHLHLAQLLSRRGQRDAARWQLEKAIPWLERGRDKAFLDDARRLLRAARDK